MKINSFKGLYTNKDSEKMPEGALKQAENVLVNDGKLQVQTGTEALGIPVSGFFTYGSSKVNISEFQENGLIYQSGDKYFYAPFSNNMSTKYNQCLIGYNGTAYNFAGSGITQSVSSINMNKNLYKTGASGIYKFTMEGATADYNYFGTPYLVAQPIPTLSLAGLPVGTTITVTASAAIPTFLPNNESVAYKYIISNVDANGVLYNGGTSNRVEFTNTTGASTATSCRVYLPKGCVAGWLIRLYRTENAPATVTPNAYYKQCYEHVITAGDITTGYVDIVDILNEDSLQTPLYTNDDVEGSVNDNIDMPYAIFLETFKNFTMLGNCKKLPFFDLQLLGTSAVPATNSLVIGDTITIDGQVYTASAAENIPLKQFLCYTASPSPAINMQITIQSLITCVNANSAQNVYAIDNTKANTFPGRILFKRIKGNYSTFNITTSKPGAFIPDLSIAANQVSDQFNRPNSVIYSKLQQPEHYADFANFLVGSENDPILKIVTLRESMFIFKQNEGVYVLRGDNPANFNVELFDGTVNILSPECVTVVNNMIYAYTNKGIVAISEGGVTVLSLKIDDYLNYQVVSGDSTLIKRNMLVCGDEQRGLVYFKGVNRYRKNADLFTILNVKNNEFTEKRFCRIRNNDKPQIQSMFSSRKYGLIYFSAMEAGGFHLYIDYNFANNNLNNLANNTGYYQSSIVFSTYTLVEAEPGVYVVEATFAPATGNPDMQAFLKSVLHWDTFDTDLNQYRIFTNASYNSRPTQPTIQNVNLFTITGDKAYFGKFMPGTSEIIGPGSGTNYRIVDPLFMVVRLPNVNTNPNKVKKFSEVKLNFKTPFLNDYYTNFYFDDTVFCTNLNNNVSNNTFLDEHPMYSFVTVPTRIGAEVITGLSGLDTNLIAELFGVINETRILVPKDFRMNQTLVSQIFYFNSVYYSEIDSLEITYKDIGEKPLKLRSPRGDVRL